jgi:hypothetical protein
MIKPAPAPVIAAGTAGLTFTSFGRRGGGTEANDSGLTETLLKHTPVINRPPLSNGNLNVRLPALGLKRNGRAIYGSRGAKSAIQEFQT